MTTFVRIACSLAKIRTAYLPNTNLGRYRLIKLLTVVSCNSSVARLRVGRPGFDSSRQGLFFSPPRWYRLRGSFSLLANGYQELCPPGVRWLGRETNHTPPSSVEVRMHGAVRSPPIIRLYGVLFN
jgi:hypothetical protein